MTTLQQRLGAIERELHTLETATPRNSASVDRGGLSVVDEGSVILEAGGTVYFGEGGSAVSGDYDLEEQRGWQIGTERRGTSVVVVNDVPGTETEVSTANSSASYEEVSIEVEQDNIIELGEDSMLIVQLHHISPDRGSIEINNQSVLESEIIKSAKTQWTYNHMETFSQDVNITTDLAEVTARVVRLSVNNVS